MLKVLERILEAARGVGLDLVESGLTATAAVLNALGRDKSDVAKAIRLLRLAGELRRVAAPLNDPAAFELRTTLVAEMLLTASQITPGTVDDELAGVAAKLLEEEAVRQFALHLLTELFSPEPLANEADVRERLAVASTEYREALSIPPGAVVRFVMLLFKILVMFESENE